MIKNYEKLWITGTEHEKPVILSTTGLTEQDKSLPGGEKYLKYQGKYYTSLGEKRIPYQRGTKTQDSFGTDSGFDLICHCNGAGAEKAQISRRMSFRWNFRLGFRQAFCRAL